MSEKTFFVPTTPSDLEREDLVSMMGYNYLTCLNLALDIFGDLSDIEDRDTRRDREIFLQDTYRELNRLYNVRNYRCVSCDGDCSGKEKEA